MGHSDKRGWGGARLNAGRPPELEGRVTKSYILDEECRGIIARKQETDGCNQSDALRRILREWAKNVRRG